MQFKLKPFGYHNNFSGILKGGFKFYARKCYLFKNYKRFESIINKYPQTIEFMKNNIRASNEMLHMKYGSSAFSFDYGYDCLDYTLEKMLTFFPDIFKKTYLLAKLNDDFSVYIRSGANMLNEGFFTIYTTYQNQVFFNLNFIITKENNLLITCIQGLLDSSDIIKTFTKDFFGLRPAAFLINFADVFREFLSLDKLLGVDDKYIISGFKRGKVRKNREYVFNNYNTFWEENCDIITKQKGFFQITPNRKNLEEIPSKKRSMYKKRFEFLDNLQITRI